METIKNFRGKYNFLSNMFNCNITIDNNVFTNAEAYFQSLKCRNLDDVAKFVGIEGSKAKQLGKKIDLIDNWNDIRYETMVKVLFAKFNQNEELKQQLIDTYPNELVEGNHWHDNYWGVCSCDKCSGKGQNSLGIALMQVRDSYLNIDNNIDDNIDNNKGDNEMTETKTLNMTTEEQSIGAPKYSITEFGKEKAKPTKYNTISLDKYLVRNISNDNVYVAICSFNKYRIFDRNGLEVFSRRLDRLDFMNNYSVISVEDIEDETERSLFDNLYNNIENIEFPNGYPHREKALVISFSSVVYIKELDKMAIVTHTNGETVGKGYMEVSMNESLLTIYNQQMRKLNSDYYGTMIIFKSSLRKEKYIPEEDKVAMFSRMIDDGFVHIKDGKMQLDKFGNPIVYRDCLATSSQTRTGYLSCCREDEFDLIHNQAAFMGLPLEGKSMNVAKTKARGGNVNSNGTGIGTRDIYGNLKTPDTFNYTIIKDVEQEEELFIMNPIEIACDATGTPLTDDNGDFIQFDDNKHQYAKMIDCGKTTVTDEVNKNDGYSLATQAVMALMSLRMRLINKTEYEYFMKTTTLASFSTFARAKGTEYVINKIIKVAKKNNISFDISMLGEEMYSALLDCQNVLGKDIAKALRTNCKALFDACVNDLYYFTNINMNLINKNSKLNKIWKKISDANIVRYQQTFVKGLLVAWDVESKTKYETEIVLTESMVKIDVEKDYPDHEINSDLPWLVCKVATAKDYSEYNTQYWMQLDLEANDLVDLAKDYIGKLERSFSEVTQALETLGAIGVSSEMNKIGELLNIAPELLNAGFIQRKIASTLKYKLAKITKGKIPVKGGFRFIITDPRILTGEKGALESGEYYLNGMEQDVVISRNPAISKNENHKITLVNNERTNALAHLKNVLVMNTQDCVWLFLGGADFDGDIVFVCWDELILKRFRPTKYGINIVTRGKRILEFTDETRKMLYKENLGGGQTGLLTDQIINFQDFAYSTGWDYELVEGLVAMGVNYVGKEIDSAKTGEKFVMDSEYETWVIYGGEEPNEEGKRYQIKKADWMHFVGQEKKGKLGENFYKNPLGEDIKWKIRESKSALGHLFRYMASTYNVHLCPTEANSYFEDNCMLIDDQPILDKLYTSFNKEEVDKACEDFVMELDKNFRIELAKLMSTKSMLDDNDQFNTMMEELELKHTLLFEQACELHNVNPMIAAIASYVAPTKNDIAKGNVNNSKGSNTSCSYVLHCAYEHFYNACKLAFDGVGMFRLPVRTLEEELEVVDSKVSINGIDFNVKNIEDGLYNVVTLASDNQYLVYTRNNSDIQDKVNRYNEIRENKQAIVISTRIYGKKTFDCPINGKGKATPMSTFLNIQLNDGEFTIRKDKNNNYIVMVDDTQVGIVVKTKALDINPAWADCKFKLPFLDSMYNANNELCPKAFASTFGSTPSGKISQRLYKEDDLMLGRQLFDDEEAYDKAFENNNGIREYLTLYCETIETLDEEIVNGLSYAANFDFVKKSSEFGIDINGYVDQDIQFIDNDLSDIDMDCIEDMVYSDMDSDFDYEDSFDYDDNFEMDSSFDEDYAFTLED